MNVGETKKSFKALRNLAAIIIIMVAFNTFVNAQSDVLKQELSIKMTNVKKQAILRSLTRQTGYTFTYDTELIKPQEYISLDESANTLRGVLDNIFSGENFAYSVIENHIIIYKLHDEESLMIREVGRVPVYHITGTIVESNNSKPLAYATVGIYKKGLGTISNDEGEFSLKVSNSSLNDSIKISYLGFVDRMIPVNQAIDNHYVIEMDRDYIPIPEVIIRARNPIELIGNVHRNIESNYGSSPVILKAFYRESVSKKTKILLYSEAVINIFKSAYTKSLKSDQVSVYKSRKIENLDNSDTLILKLQAGLYSCLDLDGIKNNFDFIDPINYQEYLYQMTDIVNIGDEAAFVVEFTQKEEITDNALFQGSLYINTENYGIHSAEFEINPDYIHLLSSNYVKESARGFVVKLQSVKYIVDYRYVNNLYYLNHVRGNLEFHARKKKKLFGSNYSVLFEMAVTEIDSSSVERFSRDLVEPRQTIFSETISQYDADFWGTDNFMQPELDILEALEQLNVKMGEFKKDE